MNLRDVDTMTKIFEQRIFRVMLEMSKNLSDSAVRRSEEKKFAQADILLDIASALTHTCEYLIVGGNNVNRSSQPETINSDSNRHVETSGSFNRAQGNTGQGS